MRKIKGEKGEGGDQHLCRDVSTGLVFFRRGDVTPVLAGGEMKAPAGIGLL